jgi:hypothetical protein
VPLRCSRRDVEVLCVRFLRALGAACRDPLAVLRLGRRLRRQCGCQPIYGALTRIRVESVLTGTARDCAGTLTLGARGSDGVRLRAT